VCQSSTVLPSSVLRLAVAFWVRCRYGCRQPSRSCQMHRHSAWRRFKSTKVTTQVAVQTRRNITEQYILLVPAPQNAMPEFLLLYLGLPQGTVLSRPGPPLGAIESCSKVSTFQPSSKFCGESTGAPGDLHMPRRISHACPKELDEAFVNVDDDVYAFSMDTDI